MDVRINAAEALGKIGTPKAIKTAMSVLIQLLQERDEYVRANAASVLGKIGEGAKDAVSTLIQALQDTDGHVRINAVQALEKIGTPEALKAVEEYESQQ